MATKNDGFIITGSILKAQEERYKHKDGYYQVRFNTLIKLNNAPCVII